MAERLSRKELYDLVWSKPLRILSSRFGISDVALKKTCARSEIPTPERGYWAKKDAEKPAFQVAFPIRPPGMDDQVLVAAGQSHWYQDWKKEELIGPLPPPPEFPEPIEAVRERIALLRWTVGIEKTQKGPISGAFCSVLALLGCEAARESKPSDPAGDKRTTVCRFLPQHGVYPDRE
jgi:hypothetical protein